MNPTAIGFWRTLIGGVALLILNFSATLRINRSLLLYALLAGFVFAIDLFVWHRSILYIGAGMSTILGNTQVFFTAIMAMFIFKEKLSPRYYISVLTAFIGLILLIDIFDSATLTRSGYLIGVLLGIATGISYAIFLIILKHTSIKRPGFSSRIFMAWISLFTALFLGIMTFIENNPLLPPDIESVLVLSMLGIISQAIGWWTINFAMSKIKTSLVALILLLQPSLATIWGALIFAEKLDIFQYLGALIILQAIYFGSLKRDRGLQ